MKIQFLFLSLAFVCSEGLRIQTGAPAEESILGAGVTFDTVAENDYCVKLKNEIEEAGLTDDQIGLSHEGSKYNSKYKVTTLKTTNVDIVVAHFKEDTSWTDQFATFPNATLDIRFAEGCDELIAFVRHIAENYDNLKEVTVFLHGGAPTDWHSQKNIESLVTRIDPEKLKSDLHGYASLNVPYFAATSALPGQWPLMSYRMDCLWQDTFWVKSVKARWNIPAAGALNAIEGYCCSQFALHRDAVRAYPKVFWKSLLETVIQDGESCSHASAALKSRNFEYLWHVMFTGQIVEPRYNTHDFTHD